jgi:hypothetical protein
MAKGPEDILQESIAEFLSWRWPDLLWWHTPNGGSRNVREAVKLKRMGVLPGVADLVFIVGTGQAVFVELKAGKNKPTESQEAFRTRVVRSGCPYHVERSVAGVDRLLCAEYEGGRITARGAAIVRRTGEE